MNQDFKYELFFELSPDLLCIAGYDGYFKKINAAVVQLLGYTREELFSRPINDFVHEDDKDITNRVRKELTRSKPLLNFENRYVTKSGDIVWLSWTSLPVDSDQLVFAIAKNITHKKRQEAERNTLLANLTRVNKDLKQLTYTTSHDLRSPVNNLLSIFSMLDVTKISDPETQQLVEFIKMAGEKLKETLDGYVDVLSEKHKDHARIEEVYFDPILVEALMAVNSLVRSSKANIHSDFSQLQKVKFNRGFMYSIFLNHITNSIKYARPDLHPDIRIYSEKVNGQLRLIFEDNGQGFDLEKVKGRIFGLHQKFSDHADSKGIGLYLIYSHITSLDGTIEIESKPNEGSRFIITFRNR